MNESTNQKNPEVIFVAGDIYGVTSRGLKMVSNGSGPGHLDLYTQVKEF